MDRAFAGLFTSSLDILHQGTANAACSVFDI